MAFSHGSNARVLLDGLNASNFIKEVGQDGETDTADTTVLGDSAKTYVPGLRDATANMSGLLDSNTDDDNLTFSYKVEQLHRVRTQATYMPAGDVVGNIAYIMSGILTNNSISTSVDDMASVELEFQNCTGMERGKVLHILENETTDADGDELDNSASSTNGLTAVLHVNDVVGTDTPTLSVIIEHSADNVTYTTLATFDDMTATGSQYVSVTGTVNQYIRASWALTGTDPEFIFHVAARRK